MAPTTLQLDPPASRAGDPATQIDHPSLLQIRYETPDSPMTAAESIDEWALSSFASDDEAAHHFIMPSTAGSTQVVTIASREVGKLRSVILGAPRSGKSELLRALHRVPPLHNPHQMYLAAGVTAISFRAFCPDNTVAFVDGAQPEYVQEKLGETASLINGLHPSAVQVLSQARSLDAFPLCDCVIYCFAALPTLSEIASIKEVARFAPIIPIITRCDQLSGVDLFERRVEIRRRLEIEQIPVHYFDGQSLPYTISTRTTPNWDMSASEVESPGYSSEVLVESQLPILIEQLLESSRTLRENAAQLFAENAAQDAIRSSFNPFLRQQKYYRLSLPNALVAAPQRSEQHPRRKMGPIGNIDPLYIGKWVQTIGVLSAAALTIAGAGVVLSPPDAPAVPPSSIWQYLTPILL